jgi:hypothetical protein
MMSCRTGPLRVGRSLRDLYTALLGASFGHVIDCADQREDHAKL